jgi:high-affinity nickel permease
MVTDLKAFVAVSIPSMFLFGMHHALDVDHITALLGCTMQEKGFDG